MDVTQVLSNLHWLSLAAIALQKVGLPKDEDEEEAEEEDPKKRGPRRECGVCSTDARALCLTPGVETS